MNTSCIWTTTLAPVTSTMTFLTYTALAPIFFILGMIGHLIALLAFSEHRKTDTAYAYQIFVTSIKTLEILFFDLWVLLFIHFADQDWSGLKGSGGWSWFKRSHFLMRFTAHATPILQSASITLPILATSAMAADRVLGLWQPIFYQTMNKNRHQGIAFSFSCFLGMVISIDNGFRWDLSPFDPANGYKIVGTTFGKTILGGVLGQTRNAIRFIATLVLLVCSSAMLLLYRRRVKKVNMAMIPKNLAKQEALKSRQRMILMLALFHTLSTAVPTLLLMGYSIANYVSTTFGKCEGQILALLIDFSIQLINAIDFYLLYLVNRSFREIVRKLIKS